MVRLGAGVYSSSHDDQVAPFETERVRMLLAALGGVPSRWSEGKASGVAAAGPRRGASNNDEDSFSFSAPEQARSLTVKAQGAGLGFTLDEPSQGGLAAMLQSGATAWCSRFGGTVKRDEPGRFLATKAPAAHDGCR